MKKLHNVLVRNKLIFLRNFIFVMLIVLVFSSVVVSVYQHQIQQMIVSDIELLNLSALEQNMQTLDSVILGLRELTYTVSDDSNMKVFFGSDPNIAVMRRTFDENLQSVKDSMTYYASSSPYIVRVYAYAVRMDELVCSSNSIDRALLLNSTWKEAAKHADARGSVRVFFQKWKDRYPYLLTLIRAVSGPNGEITGYVMVDVNVEKLGKLVLGNYSNQKNAQMFIVDASGQMILSTPYYLLGESDTLPESLASYLDAEAGFSHMTFMNDEKYVISCQDSTQENWRYILIRPYEHYFALTNRGDLIFSLMIILVLVLVLLAVVVIALTTFQPLGRIITAIEEPITPQEKRPRGLKDVERIIQSVHDLKESNTVMKSRIDEQVHEFSLEQVRALQHQMDPHFLYNVLDYFRWVAIDELGEGSALEKMARTLSEYFHIALKRSDYLVPLRDELYHIELFMQLYAYRYEGRLNIHINVPEDMMNVRVLKLSVQPIVDNAIKHGLRPRRYHGNIWIRARLENERLLIIVENDGERMDEGELTHINAQLKHPEASNLDEHIGLNNIARRIQLLFGADYGVMLSNIETGMIAVMSLPDHIPNTEGDLSKTNS